MLDYYISNRRVDILVDDKGSQVFITLRWQSGSEIRIKLSQKDFNNLFEKLEKAKIRLNKD